MKKLLIFPIFLLVFTLFSADDYDHCNGVEGRKALACGACHANAISNEVFIIDGKEDEVTTNEDNVVVTYDVRIPVKDFTFLQMAAGSKETTRINSIQSDVASVFSSIDGRTVFNQFNIKEQKEVEGGMMSINLSYAFDELILEPTTIIVQGVLSNNDGTAEGDYSFYKEIVVQPKEALNLGNSYQSFFSNGILHIDQEAADQVRVVNLQGQVVYNSIVPASESIDLSGLESGVYFAIVGSKVSSLQNFKFVK